MKLKSITLFVLLIFITYSNVTFSQAKVKPRLSVNYIKDYKDGPTVKTLVRYKKDRAYLPAQNVTLTLFKQINPQIDDENVDEVTETETYIKVDEAQTNQDGEAYFYLNPDTIDAGLQQYEVRLINDQNFKDKNQSVSFEDAVIEASIVENEDSRSIKVIFKDALGEPVSRQYLTVRLKRLYGLMQIGEEPYYKTDDDGEILVELKEELFSKSGNLDFIIKLDDSDTFGTIIEKVTGKFGVVMESKDSFDERTMWASALKAPLIVLIVPNILLLGIWGTLLILIFNLYKIFKLQ